MKTKDAFRMLVHLLLLVGLVMPALLPPADASSAEPAQITFTTISSTYASTPPNIDGKLDLGEWDYANRLDFEHGYLTVKNDGIRLYVLLNVLADTADDVGISPDYFWLTFDVNRNAAIDANVDMNYGTQPGTTNIRYQYYLGPNQWTGIQPVTRSARAKGFGCFWSDGSFTLLSLNPIRFRCTRHRVWELAIDLSEISAAPGDTLKIGFRVASSSPNFTEDVPVNFSGNFSNLISVLLAPTTLPGANASATIVFDPKPIEVTQAIQDRDNTLPLVRDKATVARVYVDVNNALTAQPVIAYLYGSVGSVDLPGSPLATLYSAPTTIDRSKLSNTANFALPTTWDEGSITFSARARTLFGAEITSSNTTLTFNLRDVPTYWYLPVNTGTNTSPVLISSAEMASQRSYTEAVFPVSKINWVQKPWTAIGPTTVANTINALNSYYNNAVIAWILSLIFTGQAPYTLPDQIYGFTPSGGGISDPTWIGAAGRVARGYRGSSREGTMAHEINHNLDRSTNGTWGRHVAGCGAAGPDPNWPYANDDIQQVGFDTRQPWSDTAAQVSVVPSNFPDYMSYCQSGKLPTKWISPYRWSNLYNNFSVPFNTLMLSRLQDIQPVFYISGEINEDGTGELYPSLIQPGIPSDIVEPANAAVVLRNSMGDLLHATPFFVDFLDDPEEPFLTTYINLQVPAIQGTAKIQLVYLQDILDEIEVSDHPPAVTITSPNGGEVWSGGMETVTWDASDPDGDPLTFNLLYSPDNGFAWYPVVSAITGNSYDVDVSLLPAGNSARMRVVASDGANTAQDDSDATFVVTDQGPVVTILAPADGSNWQPGTPVLLQGEATDLEDGDLPDERYLWMLEDDVLGLGRTATAFLESGFYTFTLYVTDSDDNISLATVEVFVGYTGFMPFIRR
jgi:hypothetical protein